MKHSNKVAVVTGAGKGIGRATALALAIEGADVVLAARTQGDLEAIAIEIRALGRKALPIVTDVSSEADVDRLFERTFAELGRVDILVNNAGVGCYAPISEISVAQYDEIMDVSMKGTFMCSRKVAAHMIERGSGDIIIVASAAGLHGYPTETAYCAAKFAQVGFAEALDGELRGHGVKVTAICPGSTETHFGFGRGRHEDDPRLEKMIRAEEVAGAIMLALSMGPTSRMVQLHIRPMMEPVA